MKKHRAKLLFDPDLSASPAVRVRHVRGPYLDRLTTTPHLATEKVPAQTAFFATATIPDLTHTGVTVNGPHLLRPDGSPSTELRQTIATRVHAFPERPPSRDVADRDLAQKARHSHVCISPKLQASIDSLASEENHRADDNDSTVEDVVFKGLPTPDGRRRRMPYSTASLARMMLEAEYPEL